MEALKQDIRYGFRTLMRNPGLTAVMVLALALGIGANTAIFSVVNAVLLNPLPYAEPERIVWIWGYNAPRGAFNASISAPDFIDYRDDSQSFEQLAAFTALPTGITLTGADQPERIDALVVSTGFFESLGAQPAMGRTFISEEEQAGKHNVVVISHGLWQRRLGLDPEIIGKSLTLNGGSFTIVGVMGADFKFPVQVDLWAPIVFHPLDPTSRGRHWLRAIGRLKPGVTVEQAQSEIDAIALGLAEQYPDTNVDYTAKLVPLRERIVGSVQPAILMLLGAVGFVLLIACANVANLLLARAATRHREIAIRMALGATRSRLIRQLLTESLMLSMLGGTVGLLLALWGVDLLAAVTPGDIPRVDEIGIDGRVLAFTIAVSLFTGLLFGLVPALQASKPDLNESLKEGSKTSSTGARRNQVRSLLVVSEIALSLVLLIGTGLMIKSFMQLQRVEPGFDPANVLTMQLSLPPATYREDHQYVAFYQQLFEQIKATAGVKSAGAISELPLTRQRNDAPFTIEGQPPLPTGKQPVADVRTITPDYFSAMGIPLLRGRHFTDADTQQSAKVIIINDTLAQEFFGDEDPIGKRITIDPTTYQIIGIARGVRHRGLRGQPFREIYFSYYQDPRTAMNLVVRTTGDPLSLASVVQNHVKAIDKDQPVSNITTMEQLVASSIAQPRFHMSLLGIFAAVALVLAVVGIYGVMNYSVTQRTHEIGIRLALGAGARDIFRLVVGQAALMTLLGVALGLAASFALTRLISAMLFGVSPTDPFVFAALSAVLAGVALGASFIPARRAIRVDPVVALRHE